MKPESGRHAPREAGDAALPGSVSRGSTDRSLRDAVLDRDRKAIGELVGFHADAIYRFIHHRLGRPEAVDDLVQEVFLAALTAIGTFRVESSLRTWLLAIARRKIADYYRARLKSVVFDETDARSEEPAFELHIDESLDRRRLEEKARAVLSTLSDGYRAVLVCRYWDQRSVSEIAGMSGKTEKAVERLLARARQQFRDRWTHG